MCYFTQYCSWKHPCLVSSLPRAWGCKASAVLVLHRGQSLLCCLWARKDGGVLCGPGSLPEHLCNSEEQFAIKEYCPGGGVFLFSVDDGLKNS